MLVHVEYRGNLPICTPHTCTWTIIGYSTTHTNTMYRERKIMKDENISRWRGFLSSLNQDLPLHLKRRFSETDKQPDVPEFAVGKSCISQEFSEKLGRKNYVSETSSPERGRGVKEKEKVQLTNDNVNDNTDDNTDDWHTGTNKLKKPKETNVVSKRDSEVDEEVRSGGEEKPSSSSSSSSSSFQSKSSPSTPRKDCRTSTPMKTPMKLSFSSDTPYSQGADISTNIDRCPSASEWDLKGFSEYFDLRKDVFYLRTESKTQADITIMSNAMSDMYKNVEKIFLRRHTDFKKETNIRVLLDGLLLRLCNEHDLHILTEEEFKLGYLPTCRFDYLLLNREETPIGCVEAKRPSSLNEKAFVQAVLEICVLQQLACHKDRRMEKVPVFCVLSDGYRFVLMQLRETQLFLEFEDEKKICQIPETIYGHLKIRVLENNEDFASLASVLSSFITIANPP